MATITVRRRDEPGHGALWFGLFAAPAAWSVDELASFYFHDSTCEVFGSPRWLGLPAASVALFGVGVLMGVVALAALWTAWSSMQRLGRDTGEGPTIPDQRRFMAHAGVIFSGIFLFGIVLRFASVFFLVPCRYQ